MRHTAPERFPVLGIVDWTGGRGPRMGAGADGRQHHVTQVYLAGPDRRSSPPMVTMFQSAVGLHPDFYLPHGLLDRDGRPTHVESVGGFREVALIEAVPVEVDRHRWADSRLADARFRWRDRFTICIASWERPLDADFFASLGILA